MKLDKETMWTLKMSEVRAEVRAATWRELVDFACFGLLMNPAKLPGRRWELERVIVNRVQSEREYVEGRVRSRKKQKQGC